MFGETVIASIAGSLASSGMDLTVLPPDLGDLFSELNNGVTEAIADAKGTLPSDVDVSELVSDSVFTNKICGEDDTQCPAGTKIKTKKGNEGVIYAGSLTKKEKARIDE